MWRSLLGISVIIVLHTVMSAPLLVPALNQLNPFDEAIFIQRGQLLLGGELPRFANNPLVVGLFAVLVSLLQGEAHWFVLAEWGARATTYALLWVSLLSVVWPLRALVQPLLPVALYALSPAPLWLLTQTGISDGLFAGLAGLAFGGLVRFGNTGRWRHLIGAATALSLSALARNDGVMLLPILLVLALLAFPRPWRFEATRAVRVGLAVLVPFLLIVGGYLVAYRVTTGALNLGVNLRSYVAFEQGQGFVAPHRYGNVWEAAIRGVDDARAAFGMPAENGHSIPRAIMRNPGAFLARTGDLIVGLPTHISYAYGGSLALVLLLGAGLGLRELYRQRLLWLLVVCLGWMTHLVVYAFTFVRAGYLLFPYVVVFMLAGLGIGTAPKPGRPRQVAVAAVTIVSIGYLAIGAATAPPGSANLRNSSETAMVLLLRDVTLPVGRDTVGAFAPVFPWAANRAWGDLYAAGGELRTPAQLDAWAATHRVGGIVLDPLLRLGHPDLYALIESRIGVDYAAIAVAPQGREPVPGFWVGNQELRLVLLVR